MDARLGAAREDGVGVPAPDQLRALADRMRAGRARGDGRVVRPRRPSEIAIWPLAESTSTLGMKNGETRSGPRSRRTFDWSTIPGSPPIAEPTTMPTRPGRPRSVRRRARLPAPRRVRAGHCGPSARLLRRRDRGGVEALHLARDPDRELARVEGLDEADPALPATAACQVEGASRPIGVIAPSPVTATRLIEPIVIRASHRRGGRGVRPR